MEALEISLVTVVHGSSSLPSLGRLGIVAVLVGGVPFFGIWAVILGSFVPAVASKAWGWGLPVLGGAWLVWALLVFLLGWWCILSLGDLVLTPVTIAGQVVYLESQLGGDDSPDHYYVAVDDGTTDRIKKYDIDRVTHAQLRYGMWLRLDVTRNLGAMVRADVLPAPDGDVPT